MRATITVEQVTDTVIEMTLKPEQGDVKVERYEFNSAEEAKEAIKAAFVKLVDFL